jgi:2,5-dihydroxypyridine 5,6-dioxygenase
MDISGRPGSDQYGYTDQPGRWDHWPGGLAAVAPIEGSVEGKLVVDKSDIIFRLGRYVEEPINITIREGRITEIEGGATARLLSDYLAHWEDDKAYIVSHIGWGCEHRALWNTLGIRFPDGGGVMDAESLIGNMQIAFGSNFMRALGGKNVTAAHIDIPCRNHTIYVDEQLIVDQGQMVPEDLK